MSQIQQCPVWNVVEQCNDQCDVLLTDSMYNINQVETVKAQDLEVPQEPKGKKIPWLGTSQKLCSGVCLNLKSVSDIIDEGEVAPEEL